MKIVFLCSSLEQGRDGVGDYTLRLSAALIKLGHLVTAISINDKFISSEIIGAQLVDGIEIQVIRLPHSWSRNKGFKSAKVWITNLNPDWVSIQFVIFAFDNKGLPFFIAAHFKKITEGRLCHIMFHELWVGIHTNSSLKFFLWGQLQMQIIKKLLLKLKPSVIHTNTHLYKNKLATLGFSAAYLPLFGNIPVRNLPPEIKQISSGNLLELVLFGTIHPSVIVKEFLKEFLLYSWQNNKIFLVTILGRTGPEVNSWTTACKELGVSYVLTGELTTTKISEILSASTIGISTTPIEFAEKSGTIAAMREHGLPVICISDATPLNLINNFSPPEGVYNYISGNLIELLGNLHNLPRSLQINQISLQLEKAFMDNS